MDSAALAKLVAYGASNDFDSLIVVRHGRIVAEAYYAPYRGDLQHQIFSSTKGVIGTLVGIMVKDGLLDRLDHPMLDFFPDLRVANVDDRKKGITVQNLLDMTSGLDWKQGFEGEEEITPHEMYRRSNWTQFILDRPMAHAPGEIFYYASVAYEAPIGLDGLFRLGLPTLNGINPGHIPALKGTWPDGRTFEIDREDLGQGRKIRYRFSFDDTKLHFHVAPENDPEVSIDGEQSDLR